MDHHQPFISVAVDNGQQVQFPAPGFLFGPAPPNWLDTIGVHDAAAVFPMMSGVELVELSEDIAKHGLLAPLEMLIEGDGTEKLLDGRNRLEAIRRIPDPARRAELVEEAWVTRQPWEYGEEGFDPYVYVISKNIRRRHLNAEERQNLAIELIARQPRKSDRQIAKDIGVDHKTIGRARGKGEDVGRIPHVVMRTDTHGRQQPASKPKREPTPPLRRETETKNPVALQRDEAVVAFAKLLHDRLPETLLDLAKLLHNERGRIARLPDHKRAAVARLFLIALDINDHTALAAAHGRDGDDDA